MIAFDPSTTEVLVESWFNDHAPVNAKHLEGAERTVVQIQSPSLRENRNVTQGGRLAQGKQTTEHSLFFPS